MPRSNLDLFLDGKPMRQDNRKRVRVRPEHDNRPRPGKKKPSRWQQQNVIAWDGEGANLEDGTHVYNLLAASNGVLAINPEGLSTKECLNLFLDNNKGQPIHVIFGGSYDVNMILKDLPNAAIRDMWTNETVRWQGYKISYAARKVFTVARYEKLKNGRYKDGKPFVLWDTFGYYQTSFVNACRKWLGDLPTLDEIQRMKIQRNSFRVEQLDEIIEYNRMECELLVLLVKALFRAMDTAGIILQRYDGAGSIAAAILKQQDVKSAMGEIPPSVYQHAQIAYSGGRIEAVKVGNAEIPIYTQDINSAYPYAALALPNLTDAKWTCDKTWNGSPYSMVTVEWNFHDEQAFYPLFYRTTDGSILYPRNGLGTYWGHEIANLYEFHKEGRDFQVNYAINVELETQSKPLDFLRDYYRIRLIFKQQGNMASEALKLGMNSIPGKFAQQTGWRDGRPPTYHHLVWAGQVTSLTRATMYRRAMSIQSNVVAFATDCIISTERLPGVSSSNGLGEWTTEDYNGITIAQAGVYWLKKEDEWKSKYRGFDPGSLDREELIRCWEGDYAEYCAVLTRFNGMGTALGRREEDFRKVWRTWTTEPRCLDTTPKGKRIPFPGEVYYARGLCRTLPAINHTPEDTSLPYPIAWIDGPTKLRPKMDEVDIRTMEEEWTDSYE